ncbi:hypothetical protein L6164_002244 [Bauhinia variegata]|uniref:Uncharacterized protein n=1 Tax=Bauhinia variegata TaxID=167791 RepID=A0ACB9PZQ6_BAUVA|nr:hypothetical protein L6164_002244 [Bauhinia variegata]
MAHKTQTNADDHSWMLPIEVMLGSIIHREVQACSICWVPHKLRKQNEDAHKPKTVALGPLHRGTRSDLLLMEEPKWHYMRFLLHRAGNPDEERSLLLLKGEPKWHYMQFLYQRAGNRDELRRPEVRLKNCGSAILALDNVVRAIYGGNIELEPHELAKIMLLDGCFLLELLLRLRKHMTMQNPNEGDFSDDPIFKNEEKRFSVLTDLNLLENQIPFIVLKKLYSIIFPVLDLTLENDHRVADLVQNAFGYHLVQSSSAAHLLHLVHSSIVLEESESNQASQELKRCATKLRAAGITIQPANSTSRSEFVDIFDFNIKLIGRVLVIPPLHIREKTEVYWRNFIAWEQSRIGIGCKFTSYALFFKGLVCCEHDIKLLEKNKLIINEAKKSREDLLKLFHTITEGVDHMDSSYSELCMSLNKYSSANPLKKWPIITWHHWNRILAINMFYWENWYHILVRDHIPTVWKLIGVLAAGALLALTVVQTYYAVRS